MHLLLAPPEIPPCPSWPLTLPRGEQGPLGGNEQGKRHQGEAHQMSEHPCVGPAPASKSTHPQDGLAERQGVGGAPPGPKGLPRDKGWDRCIWVERGEPRLSSGNSHFRPAFLPNLQNELCPHLEPMQSRPLSIPLPQRVQGSRMVKSQRSSQPKGLS